MSVLRKYVSMPGALTSAFAPLGTSVQWMKTSGALADLTALPSDALLREKVQLTNAAAAEVSAIDTAPPALSASLSAKVQFIAASFAPSPLWTAPLLPMKEQSSTVRAPLWATANFGQPWKLRHRRLTSEPESWRALKSPPAVIVTPLPPLKPSISMGDVPAFTAMTLPSVMTFLPSSSGRSNSMRRTPLVPVSVASAHSSRMASRSVILPWPRFSPSSLVLTTSIVGATSQCA